MIHIDGIDQNPCRPGCRVFCTLVMQSCGVRTRLSGKATCEGRVAQILNPCYLLLRSFGARSMFQASQPGSVEQQGELRLELWCTETTFPAEPPCSISDTVGFVTVGPLYPWTVNRLLLGLLFCRYSPAVGLSESSRASRKAAVADPIRALSRASKSCSSKSPAVVASRIMSKIRDLPAVRAPRCAGRATSRALLWPIPDWLALSVACSWLSSENPRQSLSNDLCPTSSKIWAASLS